MRTPAGIRRRHAGPARQRGLGLLVFLIVAGVLAVVLVGNVLVDKQADAAREQATRAALAAAKEALIAYAVGQIDDAFGSVPDTPGHLPCPAIAPPAPPSFPEGSSSGTCGDANDTAVGRLPWRTLGIPTARDGTGECLWYAVSGRFKHSPRGSETFNWDSEGQIRVLNADGSLLADKVAAVVIAPGPPLAQARAPGANAVLCAGSHNPADYLEAARGASNHTMTDSNPASQPAVTTMIAGGVDPATGLEAVNDHMAIITTDEVAAAYVRRKDFQARPDVLVQGRIGRLMRVVAGCLASFGRGTDPNDRRLPWAGGRVQTSPITQGGTTTTVLDIRSDNGLLAGRAPSRYDSATAGFGNQVNPSFFVIQSTSDSPCVPDDAMRAWWNQWRDHFYYVVSPDFSPAAPKPVTACASLSPNRCLRVNGSDARYAAVLIFAGRRLSNQNRPQWSADTTSPIDARQTYANYLEGLNLDNIAAAPTSSSPPSPAGTGYTYRSDAAASATLDDFAFCIEVTPTTTTVNPCPTP